MTELEARLAYVAGYNYAAEGGVRYLHRDEYTAAWNQGFDNGSVGK